LPARLRTLFVPLVALASCGPAIAPEVKPTELPSLETRVWVTVLPDPIPATPAEPAGPFDRFVFLRPAGCSEPRQSKGRRMTRECTSEERMEVRLYRDGRVWAKSIEPASPRNPYPEELARQWRHCPFRPDAKLAARPDWFVAYEDPDVGLCYVNRAMDPVRRAAVEKAGKLALLKGLHPYFADACARVVVDAKTEGIDVKVISGVRPHTIRTVWVTKTVKKKGKNVKVKVKQTVKRRTWHTWGLGVDFNLVHRNDLNSAVAAYLNDPKEHAAWERIGAIATAAGMKWLGPHDVHEIFHFEWHPGWPGLPSGKTHVDLKKRAAKDGNEGVWEDLRYDPRRPTAFKHLRDGSE
jgi:hypothetical protein